MNGAQRLLEQVRARRWFYEFDLPDGTRTESYLPLGVQSIHTTRRAMVNAVLDRELGPDCRGLTAIDLACHQGWFALDLARRGFDAILGVDAREEHLGDARLMAELQGVRTFRALRLDLEEAGAEQLGVHDLTLMLGLLYHLENPVRALRLARAATRRVLIVESQVVPGVAGSVDWGASIFRRELRGIFGLVDETEEIAGAEAGLRGICLAPSAEALGWLLRRVGFERVLQVRPPPGGNEQLLHGRRVMFAAFAPMRGGS